MTRKQHATYRIGGDFDVVTAEVGGAVRYKQRYGMRFPEIHIRVLLSAFNEQSYTEFINMANGLGVDVIHFTGIHNSISGTDAWFPKSDRFRHRLRASEFDCPFNRTLMGISAWDGRALLCCGTVPEAIVSKFNAFATPDLLDTLVSTQLYDLTLKCGTFAFCEDCAMAKYKFFHETHELNPCCRSPSIARRIYYGVARLVGTRLSHISNRPYVKSDDVDRGGFQDS